MKLAHLLLGLLVAAPILLIEASAAQAAGPSIGGCPVFPADHVWNTPIDNLPLDANSAAYLSTIGAAKGLKADFGSGLWDGGPIGIGLSQDIDSNMAVRNILWCHGASIQDKDSNVVLNSPETLAALEYTKKLYSVGMTQAVLSWNAASNNQAFNAQETAGESVRPVESPTTEQQIDLTTAIRELPPMHRAVIHLFYREELSIEEIASVLGIPTGTVKSRLHHARDALKRQLTAAPSPNEARSRKRGIS